MDCIRRHQTYVWVDNWAYSHILGPYLAPWTVDSKQNTLNPKAVIPEMLGILKTCA